MHEFALAQNIIASIEANIDEDLQKLTAIHIEVGEFAGVVVDSLQFGLQVALQDRDINGVRIDVSTVPATAVCECENEYNLSDMFQNCPRCSSYKRKVISGTDVIVRSVEVS
jgi:hydrogenase nickel incorporation protein HypA/HybF